MTKRTSLRSLTGKAPTIGPRITTEPSRSSYAVTSVHIDAVGRDLRPGRPAHVDVVLEQDISIADRPLILEISGGDALGDENHGWYPVRLKLRNPNALEALINALLGLTVNPIALQMLASMPEPATASDDSEKKAG